MLTIHLKNSQCNVLDYRGAVWESPTWGLPRLLSRPRGPCSESRSSSDFGEGPRTPWLQESEALHSESLKQKVWWEMPEPLYCCHLLGFEKWQGGVSELPQVSSFSQGELGDQTRASPSVHTAQPLSLGLLASLEKGPKHRACLLIYFRCTCTHSRQVHGAARLEAALAPTW